MQITAEQIVREAKERQEDEMGPRLGRVGVYFLMLHDRGSSLRTVKNPKTVRELEMSTGFSSYY